MLWAKNGPAILVRPEGCRRREPTDHPPRLSASAAKHGGCGGTYTSRRNPGWRVHVDRWQLPVPRIGCPPRAGGPDLSGSGFPVPIAHPCPLPGDRCCRGRQTCRLGAGTRYAHSLPVVRTLNTDLPALESGTPYPGFRSSPVQINLGRRTDPSRRQPCRLPSCHPRRSRTPPSPTGPDSNCVESQALLGVVADLGCHGAFVPARRCS